MRPGLRWYLLPVAAVMIVAAHFSMVLVMAQDSSQAQRQADLVVDVPPKPSPIPAPTPTPTPAATPVTALSPAPIPAPAVIAKSPSAAINDVRAAYGLAALAPNAALMAAADGYARTMAESGWFDHVGPGGSTFIDRIGAAGYTGWYYSGEVLYMGPASATPLQVVEGWLGSPVHRSVVLTTEATEIGVACYVSGDTQWCVGAFGAR